nr:glycosyltransferase family 4 protein [Pseudomonas sp. NW5]
MEDSSQVKHKHLVLVTTVPQTLSTILRGQPGFLGEHFALTLVTSPDGSCEEIAAREGVPVQTVSMRRGISPLHDLLSLVRMIWLLLKLRPDAIHSYTPKAGLIAMLAGFICRVPVRIHTFTGLIFPTASGFRQRLLIQIDRLICACATRVVPEGEGVRRDLQKYAITSKPLEVIGFGNIAGVDTCFFAPWHEDVRQAAVALRRKQGIPEQAFVFCFVGRLNRDKGIDELAEAFFQGMPEAHLLIVGDVDESAPVSAEVLDRLAAHGRVHLLGFQQDVRPALMLANVLVLPSYREGFPNVVLQAGAMQRPVIATDISGCNEVITPGRNGWLVPPRDVPALGRIMREVHSMPGAALNQMGIQARQRIEARFERAAYWQRLLDFYGAQWP